VISDAQGRYWFLYHAYAAKGTVFTGREAMLDQVVFGTNDWPSINHGTGPSAESFSPFDQAQARTDLAFDDNFNGKNLNPSWQWPQSHPVRYRLLHGQIELSGKTEAGPHGLVAVLAHSTLTANYTATTMLDVARLKDGTAVGLSAFGDLHNAVGLSVGGGKLTLWRRERGDYQSLAEASAPPGKTLTLRLVVKDGFQFHFAASADGSTWTPVGESLSGKNLPPWDRSVRIALTVEGNSAAEARFNSFHLTPAVAQTP
jgi:beta-xylosidase